jgi:hypothetical protein
MTSPNSTPPRPPEPTPNPLVGPYQSVKAACRYFGISRSSFYRLARQWPEFRKLLVRIPPETGPIRVPLRAVEELLKRTNAS